MNAYVEKGYNKNVSLNQLGNTVLSFTQAFEAVFPKTIFVVYMCIVSEMSNVHAHMI